MGAGCGGTWIPLSENWSPPRTLFPSLPWLPNCVSSAANEGRTMALSVFFLWSSWLSWRLATHPDLPAAGRLLTLQPWLSKQQSLPFCPGPVCDAEGGHGPLPGLDSAQPYPGLLLCSRMVTPSSPLWTPAQCLCGSERGL